jgi:hypothetical protein
MIELHENFEDDAPHVLNPKPKKQPGAAWLNWFLFQKKGDRGDLVATISFLAFLMLLVCTVFGGSEISIGGHVFKISAIDWKSSVPLITVIIGYIVKSSIESK